MSLVLRLIQAVSGIAEKLGQLGFIKVGFGGSLGLRLGIFRGERWNRD